VSVKEHLPPPFTRLGEGSPERICRKGFRCGLSREGRATAPPSLALLLDRLVRKGTSPVGTRPFATGRWWLDNVPLPQIGFLTIRTHRQASQPSSSPGRTGSATSR